jgi:hypothetical protein
LVFPSRSASVRFVPLLSFLSSTRKEKKTTKKKKKKKNRRRGDPREKKEAREVAGWGRGPPGPGEGGGVRGASRVVGRRSQTVLLIYYRYGTVATDTGPDAGTVQYCTRIPRVFFCEARKPQY